MNQQLAAIINQASEVILGKEKQIRLALACFLANGHLLIEDMPGMGKTTLAHVLAKVLGLDFQRIQFTSDLLPADILGACIFDRGQHGFTFHPGPIFAQLVMADEINRATPKTQSALLEAMEERQVTIDGETRALPAPFFVVATQNPSHQIGTFMLPESQLDRFLIRIALLYPDEEAERHILTGCDRRELLETVRPVVGMDDLLLWRKRVPNIHASEGILDYLQAIVRYSRNSSEFVHGLSPRASLALLRCAQAWCIIDGRDYVLPEDIQAVLASVINHRLHPCESKTLKIGYQPADLIFAAVDVQ